MSQRIRLEGLLAKIESTYGTDPTPVAGTDGVRLGERAWATLRPIHSFQNLNDDDHAGNTIIVPQPTATPQGRMMELEVMWPIRGAGVAYSGSVYPEAAPFFKACSFAETTDFTGGAEFYDYALSSTATGSVTVYGYAAGILYIMVGGRGSLSIPLNAGQRGMVRFRIRGLVTTAPAHGALPSITYDTSTPPTASSLGLTIGAYTPKWITGEIDAGATAQQLDDINAVDGLEGFEHDALLPVFRFSARVPNGATPLTTFDPYAGFRARTSYAVSGTLGSTQYERMDLTIASAVFREDPQHIENNNFNGWDGLLQCADLAFRFD